jgi:hypothetical protein
VLADYLPSVTPVRHSLRKLRVYLTVSRIQMQVRLHPMPLTITIKLMVPWATDSRLLILTLHTEEYRGHCSCVTRFSITYLIGVQ